jgi:hypothetical protein
MERATQSNLRAINTTFDNVTSIFDAAIKREREKRKVVPIKPDRDPPPRAAA